jgi:hypothetical protein
MKINRKGVTRIVFVFKTFVVKIPNFTCQWNHFLKGIIGNIEESKTWEYNSGEYENGNSYLLCPVLWCSWGGWVLVMKRAETFTYEEWEAMIDTDIREHKKHFSGDDTMSNYGMIDGRIVKIDYADLDCHWGEDFKTQ